MPLVVSKLETSGEPREVPIGRRTADIIDTMQNSHPLIFNPRASFDGVKNLFISRRIEDGTVRILSLVYWPFLMSCQFDVQMGRNSTSPRGRYTVRLSLVSQINPRSVETCSCTRVQILIFVVVTVIYRSSRRTAALARWARRIT